MSQQVDQGIKILRVFESSEAKSRKIIEATGIAYSTKEPLEPTP